MAENIKVLCDRDDIVAIADAVRSKTGTTNEMTLGGIASGIEGIEVGSGGSGGGASLETCEVTVTMYSVGGSGFDYDPLIYTTVENGQIKSKVYYMEHKFSNQTCAADRETFTCVKNTVITMQPYSFGEAPAQITGDIYQAEDAVIAPSFIVSGDGTIVMFNDYAASSLEGIFPA